MRAASKKYYLPLYDVSAEKEVWNLCTQRNESGRMVIYLDTSTVHQPLPLQCPTMRDQ